MKKVIYNKSDQNVPLKLWLEDLEDGALEQALNLSRLPFVFKHVAIMPDSHQGYGMPIGGVLPTQGAVIPNAVGVDIGCGMSVAELDVQADSLNYEEKLRIIENWKDFIPVGFNQHPSIDFSEKEFISMLGWEGAYPAENIHKAMHQLGTLGGGNHFVELQESESTGRLVIMVHSGSRKLGYEIAKFYHNLAKEKNKQWYSNVPEDLAFFPEGSDEFDMYMRDYRFALEYAKLNRKRMLDSAIHGIEKALDSNLTVIQRMNKPHNFVDKEHHFGRNVWVHRKGATRARDGEFGMIPSSMGGYSYIVKGKGNEMSFKSCSHGAGRVMSRTKAKNTLDVEKQNSYLKEIGNMTDITESGQLDEAPDSYKDMDVVMENQKDLVEVVEKLKPIYTLKA